MTEEAEGESLADFQAWLVVAAIDRNPRGLPELVLRPSRVASFLLMLGSLGLSALISVSSPAGQNRLAALIFGLAAALFAVRVFSNFVSLRLTPEGFTANDLGSTISAHWRDIDKFEVHRVAGFSRRVVGFTYTASYLDTHKALQFAAKLVGYGGEFQSQYGLGPGPIYCWN